MMKRILNRTFAFVLALVMVSSLLPLSVFADEVEPGCTCMVKCIEVGEATCTVCAADPAACGVTEEEPDGQPEETDPTPTPSVCGCTALCVEGAVNGECAVCAEDFNKCAYVAPEPEPEVTPCAHSYGAWDWSYEKELYVRGCASCATVEEQEAPEAIGQLLAGLQEDLSNLGALTRQGVTDGILTQQAADYIVDSLTPSVVDDSVTEPDCATVTIDGVTSEIKSLSAALTDALAAAGGSTVVVTLIDNVDLSGWTPVNFNKNLTFTLDGNGKTISNLDACLFSDVNAPGLESVTIKNLNISNIAIDTTRYSEKAMYAAALIGNNEGHDGADYLEINNVHVNGGSVASTNYAGGLIGYSSTKGDINIVECSVSGVRITGGGSVGGLIGHAHPVNCTITNSTVGGNTIKTTGSDATKVGSVVGTSNNTTYINVTETAQSTGYCGDASTTLNVIGRAYAVVTITGGKYFTNPSIASATDGNSNFTYDGEIVQIDGMYSIKLAKIGETYYDTLADAVAAANEDATVTLLGKVERGGAVSVTKNLTIDLGGFTYTAYTTDGSAGIQVASDKTLTVQSGTLTAAGTMEYALSLNDSGLTLGTGGIFTGNILVSGTSAIVLGDSTMTNTVTLADEKASLTVSGSSSENGIALAAGDTPKTGYTLYWFVSEEEKSPTAPTITTASGKTYSYKQEINKYTISFDTDGGSEIAAITQDYNTAVTAPANPTKTGYAFAGWDKEIPSTMPAENVALKANWTINQYTISFNTDGGTEIPAITQDYNTAVTAPTTTPTKTGYTFAGWDKEIPTTMPAENMTITANWKANQYTLQWIGADGTTVLKTAAVDYGSTPKFGTDVPTKAPDTAKKITYVFSGWNTKTDGTGLNYLEEEIDNTGRLDANGKPAANVPASTINEAFDPDSNKTIVLYAQFAALYDTSTPTVGQGSAASDGNISVSGTTVNGLEDMQELVAGNMIGNTITGNAVDRIQVDLVVSTLVESAEELALKKQGLDTDAMDMLNIAVRVEVTAKGGASNIQYPSQLPSVVEIAVPYDFSKLSAKHVVELYRVHTEEDDEGNQNQDVQKFRQLDTKPTANFDDGTYFVDRGNTGTDGRIYIYTRFFSLYATRAVEPVTVTFKETATSGTALKEVSVPYGSTVAEADFPALNTPVGSTGKWMYVDGGEEKEFTKDTVVTEPVTVYKKFTVNFSTITFMYGDEVLQTRTYEEGKVTALPTEVPLPGHTHEGWYTDKNLTASSKKTQIEVTDSGDLVVYGKWTPNTYTVKFHPNGGKETPANQDVTYGSTYGKLPTVTHDTKYFAGWYTQESGGTRIKDTTTVTVHPDDGVIHLYAHWSDVPVTGDEVSMSRIAALGAAFAVAVCGLIGVVVYMKRKKQ